MMLIIFLPLCKILELGCLFSSLLKFRPTCQFSCLHTSHAIVPLWNCHIDNYVYKIFGFANKYLTKNGAFLIFHDDDTHILKEIKYFLETNGYDINSKRAMKSRGNW